ncbi:hypothetical protein BDF21DRAFT_143091 [Thamnidium elegans]|nr:hypothetical protein BDF21DRAFT_143091 [Thamnidium elegans]
MTEKRQKETEEFQISLKNLESEKEELEAQVQNFDNERLAFEQNRQSFINELKNKDKTADFRIASAEDDFQSKISDLQYALEEEKRMKKNLEIELNTVNADHEAEIEELKELLRQEKQKTQDALNEKWEETSRANLLTETVTSLKSNLQIEKTHHEETQSERALYKDRSDKLLVKLEEKTKAIDEIKVFQEHTKLMVARTQQDWIFKDKELKKCKEDQEAVNTAIKELLSRFSNGKYDNDQFDLKKDVRYFKESLENHSVRTYELEQCFKDVKDLLNSYKREDSPKKDINLKTDIKAFKECLETFLKHHYDLSSSYETMTEEFAQLSESHKNLTDIQLEWRTIASRMAEKLEEFRKSILYEIVIKLQLPMDEVELGLLSRNLSPSDDDAAIWNEVLQLSSAINIQRFVMAVLENAKNLYDNFVVTKSQLKKMKGKPSIAWLHILLLQYTNNGRSFFFTF